MPVSTDNRRAWPDRRLRDKQTGDTVKLKGAFNDSAFFIADIKPDGYYSLWNKTREIVYSSPGHEIE